MTHLTKSTLVNLSKKAKVQLAKKNLTDVKATVALVLDVSKSMYPLYRDGVMQMVIERILALAINFADDKQVDAFVFGTTASQLAPITTTDFEGYIAREIMAKHKINQATKYATAIERLQQKYVGRRDVPVYVIFITDGDNSDKKETKAWMIQLCRQPIFWQFVGIGHETFKFLTRLDELKGRAIDNAGFMQVNDIATISDDDLYARLLNEFPEWLREVKRRGIIA